MDNLLYNAFSRVILKMKKIFCAGLVGVGAAAAAWFDLFRLFQFILSVVYSYGISI